jgi:predicted HTH transcriptional regulator
MTEQDIIKLIQTGECINIEFKESKKSPTKDIYKTICAFLNRIGGHILLGVEDNGKIIGVKPEFTTKIKKEIITSANNPQKIHPPVSLAVEDIMIEGKQIIVITVPESSQVHRCNGKIYDRNEDGDFDITNNNDAVAILYLRKQSDFSENKIYPYLMLKDFNPDVIARVKRTYSKGGQPQLVEEDVFKIIIPLVPETALETVEKSSEKTTQKTTQKILELIKENPYITRKELAEKIGHITEDGIKYHLNKMKKEGKIKRVGPDKGGHWKIIKK